MQLLKSSAALLVIMLPVVTVIFALPPFEGFLKSLPNGFKLLIVLLWLMAISVVWEGV